MALLSIFFFFFSFFLILLKNWRPGPMPVNWSVVGMLPTILANHHRIFYHSTDILVATGRTFKFRGPWLLRMDFLLTCDPANVKHILCTSFPNYPKGKNFQETFQVLLGDGIINADGESWQAQRKAAVALLTARRFRSLLTSCSHGKVETALLPLLDRIAEHGTVVDLQDVFLRFNFDVNCLVVTGVDTGCLAPDFPTVPFAEALHQAEHTVLLRHVVPKAWWKLLRWLRVGEEKKLAAAAEVMDSYIAQIISDGRERNSSAVADGQDEREEAPTDLLTSYMNDDSSRSEEGDKFLHDRLLNLLAAGLDTIGAGLTWLFWLLSSNPNVEAKILEELRWVAGGPKFDTEEIMKLAYLHAVVCETLRLFPPVPFNHKKAVRDDMLPSGHRICGGETVLISMQAMGRMEAVWGEDCLEFKPERWIDKEGTVRPEPSYKFIAFSTGPRACLGKDMALTQIKAVAAAVIYHFHVHVVAAQVAQPKLSVVQTMKDGLMVRLTKRSIKT